MLRALAVIVVLHGLARADDDDGEAMKATPGTSIEAAVENALFAERPSCSPHCTTILERASLGAAGFVRVTRTERTETQTQWPIAISLVFGQGAQWWSTPVPGAEWSECGAGHCGENNFDSLDVRPSRGRFVATIRVRHARYTNEPPRTRSYNYWYVTVDCKLDATPRCTSRVNRGDGSEAR
jgi:hypothetical protein